MDFFKSAYEGQPPWDIGRPQPELVALAERGDIAGRVLDVGCGTGENALYLAGLGHLVWGVDLVPLAIEKARDKARQRGIDATFLLADALDLGQFGQTFDTVVDIGLFHAFSDDERVAFVKSLGVALHPGGTYFMLCFSDRQPGTLGPRRLTQDEIRATFQDGWRVNYIREAIFETRDGLVQAWLASIGKTGGD